jgi:DNA repair protein RadA/Sms
MTGIGELDRVLGGGLVPGAVILIGGEPGIGKSTLLLQAASRLATASHPVLYVSAEESGHQVKMRSDRLGLDARHILLLPETDLESILAACQGRALSAVIVDSIQTIATTGLPSGAGSVSQVRECATQLASMAKNSGLGVFLIGHVTKDGSLAGPKTLEHLVDAVISFEGERFHSQRVVRALKNRFGPIHELGVFEMTGSGLVEVKNPSILYLASRMGGRPGSAVLATVEGTRPLLIEVQALTVATKFGMPRRTSTGFDPTRLALLLAVLERHGNMVLSAHDVFVNLAGGAESSEPAADLAVLAAVATSFLGRGLPENGVLFGEVGLLGEIRPVPDAGPRLKEAAGLGFKKVFLPAGNAAEAAAFPDLEVQPLRNVDEFLRKTAG